MDGKVNSTMNRYRHSTAGWLNGNGFRIVLFLSLLHIGLAHIHTRHSGTTNSKQSKLN